MYAFKLILGSYIIIMKSAHKKQENICFLMILTKLKNEEELENGKKETQLK